MIPLLYILNLFDAASTHYLISTSQITEGNPLMDFVLSTSWWWFWSIKVGVVGALCLILYKYDNHEWSWFAQNVGIITYAVLAIHHLSVLL